MFTRLARTCFRHRGRVVLLWVALLMTAIAVASAFGGELRNDFSLPGTESQAATDLLESGGFVFEAGQQGQVVIAADGGVDQPSAQQAATGFLDTIRTEVPEVSVSDPFRPQGLVAPDGSVAIAEVSFGDADLATAGERAEQIAELRGDAAFPDGVQVELGGDVFFEEAEFSSEGLGMLAAVVILLVAFGSVLAMGLPIVTALFGIGIGSAIVLVAARFIDVPDFAPATVAMVTIGVGIDYALFLVTRYREELDRGLDVEPAIVRAVDTAGRAVLFAGTTVVVALLGLLATVWRRPARWRSRSPPAWRWPSWRRSRCSRPCSVTSGCASTGCRSAALRACAPGSTRSGIGGAVSCNGVLARSRSADWR